MPLVIPENMLHAAGMSEAEAKVEIACQWFDAGKLAIGYAARLAGLSELEFEMQLKARSLPRYRCTEEMLKKLGRW